MNRRIIVPVLFLAIFIAGPAMADAVFIDEPITQITEIGPSGGLSMEQVEARYGEPERRLEPVGNPPITRWEYSNFIVYFEYRLVIHSVGKKSA
jgi:hypothetical protein